MKKIRNQHCHSTRYDRIDMRSRLRSLFLLVPATVLGLLAMASAYTGQGSRGFPADKKVLAAATLIHTGQETSAPAAMRATNLFTEAECANESKHRNVRRTASKMKAAADAAAADAAAAAAPAAAARRAGPPRRRPTRPLLHRLLVSRTLPLLPRLMSKPPSKSFSRRRPTRSSSSSTTRPSSKGQRCGPPRRSSPRLRG